MASDRKRKGLSKKTRFEVFKRDSFTCQYCGRAAPEVLLECDHISPIAAGGEDDVMNLLTSCRDCNQGKSDRALSDHSVIAKQRAQLEELNERREQLEMMLQWREGLKDFDEQVTQRVFDYWNEQISPCCLAASGEQRLRDIVKKIGMEKAFEAIDEATSSIKRDSEGKPIFETVNQAFDKMERIGKAMHAEKKKPGERERRYIRGILRNRLNYVNERVLQVIKEGQEAGLDIDDIKELAITTHSWTHFRQTLEEWITEEKRGNEAEDF